MFADVEFMKSAYRASQFPPDEGAEVAFAGRSNAGKSSAINAITGRKSLARISKTPGRTQLINFFRLGKDQRLVDLPGYGYARVPDAVREHWRKLMDAYFGKRRSLVGLILIVDARRLLLDFDRQMLQWARQCDVPVHVLLTKSDKLSRGAAAAQLRSASAELRGQASIQLFSATKRAGLEEAREAVIGLLGRET